MIYLSFAVDAGQFATSYHEVEVLPTSKRNHSTKPGTISDRSYMNLPRSIERDSIQLHEYHVLETNASMPSSSLMTTKPKGQGVSDKMACDKMYQNVEKLVPQSDVGNSHEALSWSARNQVRLLYEVATESL